VETIQEAQKEYYPKERRTENKPEHTKTYRRKKTSEK